MAERGRRRKRPRGSVEVLPSGALRVSVYAGLDPLTRRRHYLREVVPAGPKAAAEADKVMRRLAGQVDEQRHPRTSATLDQLLDRYLKTLDVGRTTHRMYTRYLEKHVRPFVGRLKAGAVDAEVLDSLYAELRRCRTHCRDRRGVDHRTPREHECDERCRPHECRPLSNTTIRHIHFVLRGAYEKGVRWRWVGVNPVLEASPPAAKKPEPRPRPPSPEDAARIVEAAWAADPDWGTFVWLTMTTGARRGEVCALRWQDVDLASGVVTYRRAIAQDGPERFETDTKTHQQRRVMLDPETAELLREHRERCEERAGALGLPLARGAFVFSLVPDGSDHLVPSSVSQRYSRLAARLGITTHLHGLRHYSATELIAAGVDVRTVAGRLGHGGGGITTLRVYAAWLAEANQRAAGDLLARMPERPQGRVSRAESAMVDPRTPRERLAVELRARIIGGEVPAGGFLPGIKQLAREQGVSVSTVHRAFELLREWGPRAAFPRRAGRPRRRCGRRAPGVGGGVAGRAPRRDRRGRGHPRGHRPRRPRPEHRGRWGRRAGRLGRPGRLGGAGGRPRSRGRDGGAETAGPRRRCRTCGRSRRRTRPSAPTRTGRGMCRPRTRSPARSSAPAPRYGELYARGPVDEGPDVAPEADEGPSLERWADDATDQDADVDEHSEAYA